MATSFKPTAKRSETLATAYHVPNPRYFAWVSIGAEVHFSEPYDTREEADNERRCIEKRLSYELIETMEGEGCYPERVKIMEELYVASGRTNCVYTGLNMENEPLSCHSSREFWIF
jgi:hypothetical protein